MADVKADAAKASMGGAPKLRPMPLSPHLQVWRWHVTMLNSILHRATGVGLYVGALVLVGWALALAGGADAYTAYASLLGSFLGKIVMFGLTVCVFFHLANGVRHLAWDSGQGFEIKTADFTAIVAIAFALVASIAIWVLAALSGGA